MADHPFFGPRGWPVGEATGARMTVQGREEETVGKIRGGDQRPMEEDSGLAWHVRLNRGRHVSLQRSGLDPSWPQGQDQLPSFQLHVFLAAKSEQNGAFMYHNHHHRLVWDGDGFLGHPDYGPPKADL